MTAIFFKATIGFIQLVNGVQSNNALMYDLQLFIEARANELSNMDKLDYFKKAPHWRDLAHIIKKYDNEPFFEELEKIIMFCFVLSSDTKYMPFFEYITPLNILYSQGYDKKNIKKCDKKNDIIKLLEFEKVKFSLKLDQIRLDTLYNKRWYN